MRTVQKWLWGVVFVCGGLGRSAYADFDLVGPSFTLRLRPAAAYTIVGLWYDGYQLIDPEVDSCQGTVVGWTGRQSRGGWVGSCHGHELVQDLHLYVDQLEVPLGQAAYYGREFRLTKSSLLDLTESTLQLHAELHIDANQLAESTRLVVASGTPWLGPIYGWLSSHTNTLTFYWTERDDGWVEGGTTAADDGAFAQLGPVARAAQYDPQQQKGVVTCIHTAAPGDHVFIWDRVDDNKLYWECREFVNPVPTGTEWRFDVVRFPYASAATAWTEYPLVCPCSVSLPDESPGDVNCDGVVNFADINPFVLALSNPAAWQAAYPGCPVLNGDINGDGVVSFADINPFVMLLSSSPTPTRP
jgi:hypothetical protein